MKKFLICLMIAVLLFVCRWNTFAEDQRFCLNCGTEVTSNFCPDCGQSSTTSLPGPANDEAHLSLKFNYEKNTILAKYDVHVDVDGSCIGTIKQQETLQKIIVVKKGMHEISLRKGDTVEQTILVDVQDKTQFSCTIKAHMFSLELKDVINSSPASAEATLDYYISKNYGHCKDADHERFSRYPEEFKDQPIHLKGRVIATSENFAGVMKVIVKDSKNDLWIVEYARQSSAPRLLANDVVDVYGNCKGITSYVSSVEAYPNLPTVAVEYLKLN